MFAHNGQHNCCDLIKINNKNKRLSLYHSSGYVYIIIMKKQSLQDEKIKGVCICHVQHDKIVACLQEKVEQLYIKSMCRHSILLDALKYR